MRIPQNLCLIGTILGIFFNLSSEILYNRQILFTTTSEYLLASLYALIIMISIKLLAEKITNQKCLGIGDAKLASLGGAWLGLKGIFVVLIMSFITAGIYSLYARLTFKLKKFQPFPFGPFISFFIFGIWIFGEDWLIHNWLSL